MNFKSIERETPGRDQVNQLHTPSKTGIPNQKSISSIRRGEIQTLAQYSMKLNQIRGEGSIYHKDHKTKLRPSSGMLWAPQQATRSKLICRPGDRFVQVRPTQERERTRAQTPNSRWRKQGWVWGDQNDPFPKLCPSSQDLQIENRYPKLNSTETLIWA